jgi:hypothetical protein
MQIRTARPYRTWQRRVAVTNRLTRIVLVLGLTLAVAAGHRAHAQGDGATVIGLPGATAAEGIAAGEGTTFYAGDLFTGDIFR